MNMEKEYFMKFETEKLAWVTNHPTMQSAAVKS